MTDRAKVFGIGFHKTGTSSLGAALVELGYRVAPSDRFRSDPHLRDDLVRKAITWARRYDAFRDNPWPILFEQMDQHFPGSKFILTIRAESDWIASAVRHFGSRETEMRRIIYGHGSPKGNEHVYLERHRRHISEVRAYFRSRPSDLLVMNIVEGEGWEALCPFLGLLAPRKPFPRLRPVSP